MHTLYFPCLSVLQTLLSYINYTKDVEKCKVWETFSFDLVPLWVLMLESNPTVCTGPKLNPNKLVSCSCKMICWVKTLHLQFCRTQIRWFAQKIHFIQDGSQSLCFCECLEGRPPSSLQIPSSPLPSSARGCWRSWLAWKWLWFPRRRLRFCSKTESFFRPSSLPPLNVNKAWDALVRC